ncbi:MAG: tetratricopeptide repeat protein [Candidatus Hydrogenedentes bacterium]|nr:tetratricopeptide repeat protein [Candidatus Hydrogenedentota bacterium]
MKSRWTQRLFSHSPIIDILLAFLIFCIGGAVGYGHLRSLRTDRSSVTGIELLYGPAAMLVQGKGFISPNVLEYPELRAFLNGEIESLPEDAVPEIVVESPSQVATYHRYLNYSVALFWRLFGISWTSTEPLLALLFAWSSLAIYGLMRLGMRRSIAFVLVFLVILSPAMLGRITELRDFSKAPFILSVLWGLGWAIRHKISSRQLLFLSIVLGVTIGIGCGFRMDLVVFMPLAWAVLSVVALRVDGTGRSRLRPLMSVLLLPLCFLITILPLFTEIEGPTHPNHHLVQGLSTKRQYNLGLLPASYRPLSSGSDCYVFSAIQSHMRRTSGENKSNFSLDTSGADVAGTNWLKSAIGYFPADFLARAYGAVLRNLRYADAYPHTFAMPTKGHAYMYSFHHKLAAHLNRFGLVYAVAVLLILAVHQPLWALGIFFFVLYVLGYIGLQCEYRHAFPLAFFPFWILGFLLNWTLIFTVHLYKRGVPPKGWWIVSGIRAAVFLSLCFILLIAPLMVSRIYQEHKIRPLLNLYRKAETTPVPVRMESKHGWTLFAPENTSARGPADSDLQTLYKILAGFFNPEFRLWHVRTRLMMVELKADACVEWLIQKYDSVINLNDFSQLLPLPYVSEKSHNIRYYFPVYELLMPLVDKEFLLGRNRFQGIALPDDQADAFLGFYEVSPPDELDFLMQVALTDDAGSEKCYQRINGLPDPLLYYQEEMNAVDNPNLFFAAQSFGRKEEACFLARAQLVLSRKPETRILISDLLFREGQTEEALDAAFAINPRTEDEKSRQLRLLEVIGHQYLIEDKISEAEYIYRFIWDQKSEKRSPLRIQLAGAMCAKDPDKAFEQYRFVLEEEPDNEVAVNGMISLLQSSATTEEQLSFWKDLTEQHPQSLYPWLQLGITLERAGLDAAAADAYGKAYPTHKDHPELMLRYKIAQKGIAYFLSDRKELLRILGEHPLLEDVVIFYIDREGRRLLAANEVSKAMDTYQRALDYFPDSERLALGRAKAFSLGNEFEPAMELLKSLINGSMAEETVAWMDQMLSRPDKDALSYWQELGKEFPENKAIHDLILRKQEVQGRAAFESGEYSAALDILKTMDSTEDIGASLPILIALSEIATGAEANDAQKILTQIEARPELKDDAIGWILMVLDQLHDEGRTNAMERLGQVTVALAPEKERGWRLRILAHLEQRETERALALCEEALSNVEDLSEILPLVQRSCDKPERLLQIWQDLDRKRPAHPLIRRYLARAYEANNRYVEAAELYKNLSESENFPRDLVFNQGCALIGAGNWGHGVALVRKSLDASSPYAPVMVEQLMALGEGFLKEEKPSRAELMYSFASAMAPDSSFVLLRLGQTQLAWGKTERAVKSWVQAIRVEADSGAAAQAAHFLFHHLPEEMQLETWLSLTEDGEEESPLPYAYSVLAWVKAGDISEAQRLADKLSAMHPQSSEALWITGVLACLAGNEDLGIDQIRTAAKERPELVDDSARFLADVALQNKDNEGLVQAERLLRTAQKLEPENLSHFMHLGEVLLRAGVIDEAIEQFTRLLMREPESLKTAELLDAAYTAKNDPEARLQGWQAISNVHPTAHLPRQRLEKLEKGPR